MDFRDTTAVVTGAGQGIGERTAERFASNGADVVVADVDGASETAEDLPTDALGVETDVTDRADVADLASETLERFGSIDVLVNNAAIYAPLVTERDRRYDEIPVEEWRDVLDVNTTGVFICCRELVPEMERQGQGCVVNVASAVMYGGATGYPHYVTSKGAVPPLTRAIAAEVGEHGVRVNAVAPGLVTSEASRQLDQEYRDDIAARQCLPQNGTPEDVVDTVEFLASEKASFISGSVLHPDGGLTYR
jgi:NAD(P)-dependent dehydrogenase (short-subunit alcohol dehydrogenase family)